MANVSELIIGWIGLLVFSILVWLFPQFLISINFYIRFIIFVDYSNNRMHKEIMILSSKLNYYFLQSKLLVSCCQFVIKNKFSSTQSLVPNKHPLIFTQFTSIQRNTNKCIYHHLFCFSISSTYPQYRQTNVVVLRSFAICVHHLTLQMKCEWDNLIQNKVDRRTDVPVLKKLSTFESELTHEWHQSACVTAASSKLPFDVLTTHGLNLRTYQAAGGILPY